MIYYPDLYDMIFISQFLKSIFITLWQIDLGSILQYPGYIYDIFDIWVLDSPSKGLLQ